MNELEKQHRKMAMEILFHRCLYYVHDRPAITDAEYDRLERELEVWENTNGYVHPESPTQTAGSSLEQSYPVSVRARARRHLAGYRA